MHFLFKLIRVTIVVIYNIRAIPGYLLQRIRLSRMISLVVTRAISSVVCDMPDNFARHLLSLR